MASQPHSSSKQTQKQAQEEKEKAKFLGLLWYLKRAKQVFSENDYRILKMLLFFGVTHKFLARFVFARWYERPDFKQLRAAALARMDEELGTIDLIGESPEKPAELVLGAVNSIINIVYGWHLRHIRSDYAKLITDPSRHNTAAEDHLVDWHIAFWSFGFYVAVLKGTGTKTPVMKMHHLLGILYTLTIRVENFAGTFMSAMGYWSEMPTLIVTIAALLRVGHELFIAGKSPVDMQSPVRAMSGRLFFLFSCVFGYARLVLFSDVAFQFLRGLLACRTGASDEEEKARLNRVRMIAPVSKAMLLVLFPPGMLMGYFWTILNFRRIYQHLTK